VAAVYEPSIAAKDDDGFADAFEQALVENAEKERIMAVSMVGPHRDDWELFMAGRPARQYASQGQGRSLAVALTLAGFRYLERIRGDAPVLLFDEIFGELDPGRGKRLLDLVGEFAQALVTSVQPATAEQLGADATCYMTSEGSVAP
jgi:DNA replication and repair protein RecF